jgi:hypothetical protein
VTGFEKLARHRKRVHRRDAESAEGIFVFLWREIPPKEKKLLVRDRVVAV